MRFPSIAIMSVLLLMPTTKAFAWGQEGHSIVAEIAQRHLTTKAAKTVLQLLGADMSLASLSSWADDVRDGRPETYNWHFVDMPLSETHYDAARDCKPTAKGDCVIAEIERARATLTDWHLKRSDRVEALKFLIHFVGDLHQPMHTVHEGRGENDLKVTYFVDPLRRTTMPTNLHSVWDSGLIRSAYWDWGAYANELDSQWLPGKDIKSLQTGSAVEWAEKTHLSAQKAVGSIKMNDVLGEDYLKSMKPVMDEQLTLAGLRLARIINEALR